jgi:predicted Ser/Thr protein kinase
VNGYGAVYLARDLQLDRPVALKIPFFSPSEGLSLRERFFREAKAAGVLSHPNLCPVYDVGEIDGVHYLSMAFIEGETLAEKLRGQYRLSEREAAELVRTLALALQEAHDRGIIHRDLKPANIMMNHRGQPVIMDFGLARQTVSEEESRLTKSGTLLGTPAYMPPEQINSDLKAMGPGCDIYSLGIILYELLTGKVPFEGPLGTLMATILLDPPPLPSLARADLDPSLEIIVLKALAKSPKDRFPSMAAFAAALTDYLDGKTVKIELPPRTSQNLSAPVAMLAPPENPGTTPTPATTASSPRTGMGCGRFILGCGLLIVLLVGIVVGGVVLIVYKFSGDFKNLFERDFQRVEEWTAIAETWSAPASDTPPEKLFPIRVQGFQLFQREKIEGITDLDLKVTGHRGVYRSPQGDFEVFIFRANDLEKEALLTRALAVMDPKEKSGVTVSTKPLKNKHFHTTSGSPQGPWLSYSFGPPLQHGFFWWSDGWLFLVRSPTFSKPEDFLKSFVRQYSLDPSERERPTRPRVRPTRGR